MDQIEILLFLIFLLFFFFCMTISSIVGCNCFESKENKQKTINYNEIP